MNTMGEIRDIVKTEDGISAFCKESSATEWSFVRLDSNLNVVEKRKDAFIIAQAVYKLREIWRSGRAVPEKEYVAWG